VVLDGDRRVLDWGKNMDAGFGFEHMRRETGDGCVMVAV
jgi:hypothetical protein